MRMLQFNSVLKIKETKELVFPVNMTFKFIEQHYPEMVGKDWILVNMFRANNRVHLVIAK